MARAEQSSSRLAARDEAAREVARLASAKTRAAGARGRDQRGPGRPHAACASEFARIRGDRSERRAAVAAQISERINGKVRVIVARDAELTPTASSWSA
jgi:hypothetical protein